MAQANKGLSASLDSGKLLPGATLSLMLSMQRTNSLTHIDQATQQKVLRLTISTLHQMLTFATTVNIQKYIINRRVNDWREFEAEAAFLEEQVRIKGTGVLAERDEITRDIPTTEQDFFYKDVLLAAHELSAYIGRFPLSAAAASYLFTLLEVFGDEVADLVKPDSIRKNKAWHEGVKGFFDLRDPKQVLKAREAFGEHFTATANDVPELAARRMVELKRVRNEFAHEGTQRVDFERFLHDTLAVVCHIAFLTTNENRISVYPWEDHMDTFSPQSKA